MKASFITSGDFAHLKPVNVFHKELQEPKELATGDLNNQHLLFRKGFTLNKKDNAKLRITADDYYKLYVNGKFVTQGPATSYPEHYYYNEIDISDYLTRGDNLIAVHVYYQGLINRVFVSGDLRCMLCAELAIDGETVLSTDESWKIKKHTAYSEMGKVGYDTAYLERYDSNSPEIGFERPDYDDSDWGYASICEYADHKLYLQPTRQLDIYEVSPVSIERANGIIRADFGREYVGYPLVKAHGRSGDVITVRLGEELLSDGGVRFDMRCNCRYEEEWILSGGEDILNQYDYKAFRYMELLIPDGAKVDEIRMLVRHYPYTEKGSYITDGGRLDKVISLCKDTVKYGTQEIFLDCPTREKGEYLGDLAISARAHAILTGDTSMIKKAIKDFYLTTKVCKGFMAVASCSLMQEIADYSLLFPAVINWLYAFEGDKELLYEAEPYLDGLYEYFLAYEDERGLLDCVDDKWNLVDWPDNLRDGYDFPMTRPRIGKGAHNVLNAFWCGFLDAMDEFYLSIGRAPTGKSERAKASFVKEFYNEETGLFCDSGKKTHSAVHSNVLPLLFGIGTEREDVKDRLCRFIFGKGLESMGVYMAYFALAALIKSGREDLAIKLATSDGAWMNMINEGATTTYEAWGKDQKWNTSLFHPWAVAPLVVFAKNVRIY